MNEPENLAIVPYGEPPADDALPALVEGPVAPDSRSDAPDADPAPTPEGIGAPFLAPEPSLYRIRFAALVTRLEGDVAIGG